MKFRRFLPGSLRADGCVVDYEGAFWAYGPCFVPEAALTPRRRRRLGGAGWCVCPAADWPSVLPAQGLVCIIRKART